MSNVSTSPLATPALTPIDSSSAGSTPRRSYSKNGLANSSLSSPANTSSNGTVAPINSAANQATTTGSGTTTTTAGSSSTNDGLKLRLDLNLEVDVRITAKVHGDVTLSLLN